MAKHRHRSSRPDAVLNLRPEPLASLLRPLTPKPVLNLPSVVEDRRLHHPLRLNRPLLDVHGRPNVTLKPKNFAVRPVVRIAVASGRSSGSVKLGSSKVRVPVGSVPSRLQFVAPKRVVVCVKRKTRKEVLHAFNKTGRGVRRRNPRRTIYSAFSC